MVLPLNLASALCTVFVGNYLRRLIFVPPPIITSATSPFNLNYGLLLAAGIFCYFTKNRHLDWVRKIRRCSGETQFPRTNLHSVAESGIRKAKSLVNTNYHGSKILQRNVTLYVSDNSNHRFSPNTNTKQNTSRFVSAANCKYERKLFNRCITKRPKRNTGYSLPSTSGIIPLSSSDLPILPQHTNVHKPTLNVNKMQSQQSINDVSKTDYLCKTHAFSNCSCKISSEVEKPQDTCMLCNRVISLLEQEKSKSSIAESSSQDYQQPICNQSGKSKIDRSELYANRTRSGKPYGPIKEKPRKK